MSGKSHNLAAMLQRNAYVLEPLKTLVERVATQVFANETFRTTLLCTRGDQSAVEPFLRWNGQSVDMLQPDTVSFHRGVPIAGVAMEHPWRVYILELPSFSSPDELIEFYVRELNVERSRAEAMRRGSMLLFRSVLCIGLNTPLNLVLSVDSEAEHAFVDGDGSLRHGHALQTELELFWPVFSEVLKRAA